MHMYNTLYYTILYYTILQYTNRAIHSEGLINQLSQGIVIATVDHILK